MGKIRSPRDATAAVDKTAARRGSAGEDGRQTILDSMIAPSDASVVGGRAPDFVAQADTDGDERQPSGISHEARMPCTLLPYPTRRRWRR